MSWQLSRFRAGDTVEVRSKAEVLATLDEHGCVDGMPFMPEMLAFCGRQLPVTAVAHKTCDPTYKTWGRRVDTTVHLADTRCDGAAHGGCQAQCRFFWKDVWLKPVGAPANNAVATPRCSEAELQTSTRLPLSPGHNAAVPRYSCQATRLVEATTLLPYWDVRQYVFDVLTRNHRVGHVAKILVLAAFRALARRTPVGYRHAKALSDKVHVLLTGRRAPSLSSKVPRGERTPTARLDLKPGDLVRIKSQAEIEQTVDERGFNRGLSFDPEEMAPYCGRVAKVRTSVTTIIILDGVVCRSVYAACRLNCPREIPSYWREIWLERLSPAP
jgi:hypothetical protein